MTTIQNQIELQVKLLNLLDSYGCSFQSQELTHESEAAYTKNNAAGNVTLYISDDVDLKDVMEDERIDGMCVTNSWLDAGFGSIKFPVKIVTFN